MTEAWIPLVCPACGREWEENPADLAKPGDDLTCENCGGERPVAEFVKTQSGLKTFRQFHA